MTDKMREEFEVAYQAACLSRAVARFDPSVFAKDHCDDYLNSLVQSAWWGWQCSRAASVERPEDFTDGGNPNARILIAHHRQIVGRWISAIEAAGLKVKP